MALGPKSAADFIPETHELKVLREAVQDCRGCALYRDATQAVFGESFGSEKSGRAFEIMMIGEQPGDKEDIAGHPFVGPAGKLLMRCLEKAEIDPDQVYVTNAVKHFKWEPRGKIRLHKKPSITEVKACKPWLEAELDAVKPKLIVCLGATAAQSLLGPAFRVSKSRGHVQKIANSPPIVATVHPASLLRAPSEADRHKQTAEFIHDLRKAKEVLRDA
ncbi:MAG TPA: UdgX family uracil-DNA binding protein [Terracidiphilus sp.]|jgi:DNA polymerase